MRVDMQGTAADYSPVKVVKPVGEAVEAKEAKKEKISADSLSLNAENAKKMEEVAGILNEVMRIANFHLEFQPYKDSDSYQVKVVDSETKEVIRKIPPDYMLEMAEKLKEMMNEVVGLFVNKIV
ncbi:flagellar protein FlaG [Syntrophomonas wolfei]|uniref:Flagellar protein FlaG n=1 Tax=Syntrophomonas wolfei TaxID=863 RepID=A0A354YVY5_9FIRM|nr:flagellar protein FlaG [Syntrophomonas wolfei]HBK53533.1 hypothetical protein [Syntrophomonas wolfei]